MDQLNHFHERLIEERARLGLSQEEFGRLGNVQKKAQYNYEKGVRSPDAAYLQAIYEHGVDTCYLLTGIKAVQQADVDVELELLADAWEAIDRVLDEADKHLPHDKKRQAAKALYLAFKNGEIQDVLSGASLLLSAA